MPLLGAESYDSIRRAISASLDSDTLPDALIEDDLYLNSALEWVASRTSDEGEHAKRAAIYYAAYLLLPAMQGQIMAAHAIHTGGQTSAIGWRTLADELLARAERELSFLNQGTQAVEEPSFEISAPTCFVPTKAGW